MIRRALCGLLLALFCTAQTSTPKNVPVTVNPTIGFAPASLAFSATVGGSSAPQTVTATNVGLITVPISIALTGANAGDFSQTNDCPGTLAAGASCHIDVTFTPGASGSRPAAVQITDT